MDAVYTVCIYQTIKWNYVAVFCCLLYFGHESFFTKEQKIAKITRMSQVDKKISLLRHKSRTRPRSRRLVLHCLRLSSQSDTLSHICQLELLSKHTLGTIFGSWTSHPPLLTNLRRKQTSLTRTHTVERKPKLLTAHSRLRKKRNRLHTLQDKYWLGTSPLCAWWWDSLYIANKKSSHWHCIACVHSPTVAHTRTHTRSSPSFEVLHH